MSSVPSGRVSQFLLAGLIPHAQLKIYPDSAHGFLFQHHAEFAADVNRFLSGGAEQEGGR
jgi:pimeloyl-ACP methyl ester carboxylesterase